MRRSTRDARPCAGIIRTRGCGVGVGGPTDRQSDRLHGARTGRLASAVCVCVCARARRVVYKRHNAYEVANVVMYARDDDDERRARDINNKDVYAECPNSTPPNVRTPTTTTGDDDDACPRRDEDGARQTTTIDDRRSH